MQRVFKKPRVSFKSSTKNLFQKFNRSNLWPWAHKKLFLTKNIKKRTFGEVKNRMKSQCRKNPKDPFGPIKLCLSTENEKMYCVSKPILALTRPYSTDHTHQPLLQFCRRETMCSKFQFLKENAILIILNFYWRVINLKMYAFNLNSNKSLSAKEAIRAVYHGITKH